MAKRKHRKRSEKSSTSKDKKKRKMGPIRELHTSDEGKEKRKKEGLDLRDQHAEKTEGLSSDEESTEESSETDESDSEESEEEREMMSRTNRLKSKHSILNDRAGDRHADDCKENILRKFPDAQCTRSKDKEACRSLCEREAEEMCQGSQGDLHKLNCKGEAPVDGKITCCCSVKCEDAAETKTRLKAEFAENVGTDGEGSDSLCVDVERERIKAELEEICRTRDEVLIARKYCLEEMRGSYFCVKNGHCFGRQCRGCARHECEAGGVKQDFSLPADYVAARRDAGDFERGVAVNVDDMKGVERLRQWCTELEDRGKCAETCREFGDRACGTGHALKYDHDDFCRRGEPKCRCCCRPVCRGPNPKGETSLIDAPRASQKEKDMLASDLVPPVGKAGLDNVRRASLGKKKASKRGQKDAELSDLYGGDGGAENVADSYGMDRTDGKAKGARSKKARLGSKAKRYKKGKLGRGKGARMKDDLFSEEEEEMEEEDYDEEEELDEEDDYEPERVVKKEKGNSL